MGTSLWVTGKNLPAPLMATSSGNNRCQRTMEQASTTLVRKAGWGSLIIWHTATGSVLWPSYNSECRGCGRGPACTWHNEFAAEIHQIAHLANIFQPICSYWGLSDGKSEYPKPKERSCFLETIGVLGITSKSSFPFLKVPPTWEPP